MGECFILIFKNGKHLNHTSRIHSPLVIVRYFNISDESDSNWNSLFRYNTSP